MMLMKKQDTSAVRSTISPQVVFASCEQYLRTSIAWLCIVRVLQYIIRNTHIHIAGRSVGQREEEHRGGGTGAR